MSFWNSTSDERRREAFRRLSEIGEPAVPTLVDLMREHGVPISGDAFNTLANLGPRAEAAVPEMIEMLDADRPDLRPRAAWVLGTIGPAAEPAVPKLAELLRHPDARLRDVAAQALGQIGGAGHAALERARTTADAQQRAASMHGMSSRAASPGARREFLESGLADPDAEVRMRAIDLLMTAPRGELDTLTRYLVQALNDPHPGVQRASHRVLAMYLKRGGATPRFLATVLKDGDAEARADVAWRVGFDARYGIDPSQERRDPLLIDALLAALSDSIASVRVYAGRALVHETGAARERALRQLRRDVREVEPILRVRAARALWDVTHSVAEVRAAYEAGLADSAKWNRVETISAIGDMGTEAALFVTHLERLSTDDAPEVRERAQKLLHAIRSPKQIR